MVQKCASIESRLLDLQAEKDQKAEEAKDMIQDLIEDNQEKDKIIQELSDKISSFEDRIRSQENNTSPLVRLQTMKFAVKIFKIFACSKGAHCLIMN